MTQPIRILRICAILALFAPLFPALGRAGTWVAFQNTYTRGTGAPVTVTNTFTLLNPATQYTLKAFNGGLQNSSTELVSNSFVLLDGVQVIGPSDFSQNVAEVNVTIFPGLTNTVSVQVRGQPGGVLTIQVIGVDNDPPTITASISPSPNAAGWNNSPVTVTFTCSDKTSGVASCPSPVTVSTEGANQVVSGTATDLAGNTATTSVTINLDMTPPTIMGTINPPPDAGGYNSGPVTVTFTCADALSGVASCSTPVSVTGEGSTQETGTAVDVAGNTATTTITVNISFNYFKIRSWQINPAGDPSQTGKCLDYGATIFLNDCANAHPVRVVELPEFTFSDGQVCQFEDAQTPPNCFHHEVVLYAGNLVVGIHNPPANTLGGPPAPISSQAEYTLELQSYNPNLATTRNQIFALDGDSIILESSRPYVSTTGTGLCPPAFVSPDTGLCVSRPSQIVVKVQNARGANGSQLVAGARDLADNEFWDFVPSPGSRPYPTSGFISMIAPPGAPPSSATPITTAWQLWDAVCASPQTSFGPVTFSNLTQPNYGQPVPCTSNLGWGSVIVVSDPQQDCNVYDPVGNLTHDIGPCIDLTGFAPLPLPAGATIRGNRRGTHPGPQLYAAYTKEWSLDCDGTCVLEVVGDYARVSALHIRGENRSISYKSPTTVNDGIYVNYTGFSPTSPTTSMLASVTELIATIDHNDMSDWMTGAIRASAPFGDSSQIAKTCTYPGYGTSYTCDQHNQLVPTPGLAYPPESSGDVSVAQDPINPLGAGTLDNLRVARNFLHHNSSSETGYGVEMGNSGGRFLVEGNTFSWTRHDITGSGEPHSQYRATRNLVLSGAPDYGIPLGRLQDFDMHGTDSPQTFVGGAGGYYVEIDGNTFLGEGGHDYKLRGYPGVNTYYHGNVSLRNQGSFGIGSTVGEAVQFQPCFICITSDFPITISNSQFADSSPPSKDPTGQLGVGDFDGDGDDDLFMATGAGWYFSPAGQREWRYLNSAPDTIDQLILGDFDGDGRTDVVGMRNGQLYVSWGGISAFDLLNNTVPPNCTMADMAVGDFDGDGNRDIFCAAWQQSLNTYIWWISYGGTASFTQVNSSGFRRSDLRFGHFAVCGTGTETDVFSVQSTGWYVSCGATTLWQRLGPSLSNSADLVVADFNGDGIADVGMPCNSGWQISYGGTQAWSACNTYPSAFSLANGAVGRFSGGPGADILLWNYYNNQGAATLWDFPGGTGTPYQLSAPDVDAH